MDIFTDVGHQHFFCNSTKKPQTKKDTHGIIGLKKRRTTYQMRERIWPFVRRSQIIFADG